MSATGRGYEGEGDTLDDAIESACAAGGLDRERVMVEVISHGGVAVPGERISSARARVRVQPVSEEGIEGKRNLEELLRLMGIDATVAIRAIGAGSPEDSPAAPVLLEVDGMDLGVLIGWRGESLRALQTVVNLTLGQRDPAHAGPRVIVDVARYRQRREQTVAQLALRSAAGVVRSGRPATLDPMPPYERRAVHLALADDPQVSTESTGSDPERRVVIRPAGAPRR